mgnify:CR=1 FL=1
METMCESTENKISSQGVAVLSGMLMKNTLVSSLNLDGTLIYGCGVVIKCALSSIE